MARVWQAAARLSFAIDKGLDAKAYAIHARCDQRREGFIGNLAGRALNGDFGVGVEIEARAHGGKQFGNQVRGKETWGSSAQEYRIDAAGQFHSGLIGCCWKPN